jgi:hydrogenase expression/formation protein HypD
MVYSTHDAVRIAEAEPVRQVVFFAIGFEATTPTTAPAMRLAAQKGLGNFTIFCSHVLTPSAIQNIPESPDVRELAACASTVLSVRRTSRP